ncbi:MAG: hypothetical protein ACRCX2_36275 [Paraclostridium sp.]
MMELWRMLGSLNVETLEKLNLEIDKETKKVSDTYNIERNKMILIKNIQKQMIELEKEWIEVFDQDEDTADIEKEIKDLKDILTELNK